MNALTRPIAQSHVAAATRFLDGLIAASVADGVEPVSRDFDPKSSAHKRRERRAKKIIRTFVDRFGIDGASKIVSSLMPRFVSARGSSDLWTLADAASLGVLLSPHQAALRVSATGDIIVHAVTEGPGAVSFLPFDLGECERAVWLGESVVASEAHVTVHIVPHAFVQIPVNEAHVPVLERLLDGAPFVLPTVDAFARAPGLERNDALKTHVMAALARG